MAYNEWLSSRESCNFPFKGDKDLLGQHLPCHRSPEAPTQVCHEPRKCVTSTVVMAPLGASSSADLMKLFNALSSFHFHGIHTLYLCAHTRVHTNRHPSAGIFESLSLLWNTLIVVKYGKHLPKLSSNAAKPLKMNLNASCYFNYFSETSYFYVSACHYSRILYQKRIKL